MQAVQYEGMDKTFYHWLQANVCLFTFIWNTFDYWSQKQPREQKVCDKDSACICNLHKYSRSLLGLWVGLVIPWDLFPYCTVGIFQPNNFQCLFSFVWKISHGIMFRLYVMLGQALDHFRFPWQNFIHP